MNPPTRNAVEAFPKTGRDAVEAFPKTAPRVVLAMPAYNRPDALTQTLESLLAQTFGDFALIIVDDRPSPEIAAIVDTYAAADPRIVYEANPVRLGMIGNWRKAFERGQELFPASEYFAWVSDHDVWHPRWLEVMVSVLDREPEVVLAYSRTVRVFATERRLVEGVFETIGMTRPEQRLQWATENMTAGNCIYGLFRARSLAQAGVFRPVVLPDRQVLLELTLLGQFKHVTEYLWYREVAREFSFQRQRHSFFTGRIPLYAYLPANLQHFAVLIWDLGVRGRGRPSFGRLAGVRYAGLQLWYGIRRGSRRRGEQVRLLLERTALGRRLFGSSPAGELSPVAAAEPPQ